MPDSNAWQLFIITRKNDLRSIAGRTSYEAEFEDVANSAWEVAVEIEGRRGREIDFADSEDQGLLLSFLQNRFVKYADKKIRYAQRDESSNGGWNEQQFRKNPFSLLAASASADPLVSLLENEEWEMAILEARETSYAEAVAYLLLLDKHKGPPALAKFLGIAGTTLTARLSRAIRRMEVQPTLFDGIEKIDPDFEVWRRPSLAETSKAQGGSAFARCSVSIAPYLSSG